MRRLLFAAFALAGCAAGPSAEPLAAYPAALAGRYDNAVQFTSAPADMRDAPADAEDDWIDLQAVTFTVVSAPAVAPLAVHAEWRGADGAISRQRLWAFRQEPGGVRIDVLQFAAPDRFAGAGSTAFTNLTEADVRRLPSACALAASSAGPGAWNAQTDPERCLVEGAGLDIRITVMPTGVLYQEQARREDGSYAFRTPAPAPYDFRRR